MIHGKIPMPRRKRTQADKDRDDAAAERRLLAKFRKHGAVVIDRSRLFSRSMFGGYFRVPTLGIFYKDYQFTCRDCGVQQTWTASRQKWWYEEVGGEMESVAIRCRACRVKERERKAEARRIHLEGLARKAATSAASGTSPVPDSKP